MNKPTLFFALLFLLIIFAGCTDRYTEHYQNGKWYFNKGLIDEAILEFKAATREAPAQYLAHHSLAVSYIKKGWFEYALKEAEIAFDLHPSDQNYKLIQLVKQKKSLDSLNITVNSILNQKPPLQ